MSLLGWRSTVRLRLSSSMIGHDSHRTNSARNLHDPDPGSRQVVGTSIRVEPEANQRTRVFAARRQSVGRTSRLEGKNTDEKPAHKA